MIRFMKVIALTGGIATGKSTAMDMLLEMDSNIAMYDCDRGARKWMEDGETIREVELALEEELTTRDGGVNREKLRKLVFDNPELRRKLEGIIHPKLRKECLEKVAECRMNQRTTLFVADVPLLFENGFDLGQELQLVVATSEVTQRARLKTRSRFDDRMISSILSAQLPIMEKVARADVVFWNEGKRSALKRQLSRFLDYLYHS